MKVLVTGRATGGSWQVRGAQLGGAIGASVIPQALDVGGYDLAVLVKRPQADIVARLQRMDVPIVWDPVDAYPQPHGNDWTRDECMAWLRDAVRLVRPVAIVAATQAMAGDCSELGLPVLALPHHAWEGQGTCVIGRHVRRVGYQGGRRYLGRWSGFMQAECARRGWEWIEDPATVAGLDIVVAVREQQGYAPRHWKSNVKLANAQGCGTPFVGNREAGYQETACGQERWADSEREMVVALDALESQAARVRASAALSAATPRLPEIAARYRAWLESLRG